MSTWVSGRATITCADRRGRAHMNCLLRNPAKDKLVVGELVLCLSIRQMRTVDCAMIAQACGFDVIVIDREHAPISAELTSAICVATLGCRPHATGARCRA